MILQALCENLDNQYPSTKAIVRGAGQEPSHKSLKVGRQPDVMKPLKTASDQISGRI